MLIQLLYIYLSDKVGKGRSLRACQVVDAQSLVSRPFFSCEEAALQPRSANLAYLKECFVYQPTCLYLVSNHISNNVCQVSVGN